MSQALCDTAVVLAKEAAAVGFIGVIRPFELTHELVLLMIDFGIQSAHTAAYIRSIIGKPLRISRSVVSLEFSQAMNSYRV